jgi:glycosyltransferase involved in cell wall biosynthesis
VIFLVMKISVCITSFNQEHYLIEAIESVLSQSIKPEEIIIVDDCSKDGSQEIISAYVVRYPNLIKPFYHERNCGIARTRTKALEAVTGDFVTYLDGDDRFLPHKLDRELRSLLRHPHAQIACSNFHYMDAAGTRIGIWADAGEPVPQGNVFVRVFARDYPKGSLFRNELVDYEAWKKVGFYDESLALFEDYDMRIRLTKQLRTVYCDELLTEYRRHKTGLSRSRAAKKLEAFEYIYRKNRPLLDNLNAAQRREVKKKVGKWMARFSGFAAKEAKKSKICNSAMKEWLTYQAKKAKYQLALF